MARNLVVGNPVLTEPADSFLVEGGAGPGNDPGTEFFAVFGVRYPENLDVLDIGMAVQILFDFARIDVFAAADDHVLDPSDDAAVSIVIDRRQVSCMHPADRIDGFPCPGLVTPIAEHDRVSPGAQLPGFAARYHPAFAVDYLDFKMRLYPPDRRNSQLQWIVPTALEAHRAGFGHPVSDGYLAHVHCRGDFLHDLDRARSPGHDSAAKRAEIEAGEFRVVQLGNEHGGYPVEHVATFCFDRFQRFQRIKGLRRIDHRCRMGHTTEIAHHHAETVIQRHGNAHARARLDSRRFSHEKGVVDQVVV